VTGKGAFLLCGRYVLDVLPNICPKYTMDEMESQQDLFCHFFKPILVIRFLLSQFVKMFVETIRMMGIGMGSASEESPLALYSSSEPSQAIEWRNKSQVPIGFLIWKDFSDHHLSNSSRAFFTSQLTISSGVSSK
jgi:hypothetical protein